MTVGVLPSASSIGRKPSAPNTASAKRSAVRKPKRSAASISLALPRPLVMAESSIQPEPGGPPSDETEFGISLPVVREAARPVIRIVGEPFFVERDDQVIYLRHERWSLLGAGPSVFEAERDLLSEAHDLIDVMSAMPLSSLDDEALRLYAFVLRVG